MPLNVLATDNFNRANENPIASPWTSYLTAGGIQLLNNIAQGVSTSLNTGSVYGGTGVGSDQWAECVLLDASTAAKRDAGLFVRAQAGGYYCWLFYDGAVVWHNQLNFSGQTVIATRAPTWANNDVLRLEITGASPSILRCYQNGVQVGADISNSGGPQSGGNPGLTIWSNVANGGGSLDDFRMGDFNVTPDDIFMLRRRR